MAAGAGGAPAARGGQNGVRHAFFPDRRRLAVEREGTVTLHDTLGRTITGVSQQQGSTSSLRFADAAGAIGLERLPVVS